MKLELLFRRLERMPFVRVLVPFVVGLLLAERCAWPLWFVAGAFALCGVMALLLRSQVWTCALLVVAGFGSLQLRVRESDVPRNVATEFEIAVSGIPADRGRYTAADGRIVAWRDPTTGRWEAADDPVLLRADSLVTLAEGDRIRCRSVVRPLRGRSEGYWALMARRGFVGICWVSGSGLLERMPERERSLHGRAAQRMAEWGLSGDAGAVASAMTAGDRSAITPELRAAYARSGLSHLLAVSGLHTGMVFLAVNGLLVWLPLVRYGHLLRNLLAVAAVWLFVAAAGFPASAVRAAMMCTCLQIALAAGSEYVGLNALAAAAFGMLLWNPGWMGDVGFLLSFAAVAGILLWGVPLCRLIRTRWRGLNLLLDALAVGIAATLATAPLVSHFFGIVPLGSILATPPAMLLAMAVVFAGLLWLVLPGDWAARPLGGVVEPAAAGINELARLTASVPGGILEYTLTAGQTAGVYLFFIGATLAAWCVEPKKSVHLPA